MARHKGIDAVVGGRLRKLREANGLSREQLAEIAGRSPSFLAKLELGSGRGRLETWSRLASALGMSMSELFSESLSPPGSGRTTSTNITGDQGTGVEKWPRDGARRDDVRAPKRVKARVISSSLRS